MKLAWWPSPADITLPPGQISHSDLGQGADFTDPSPPIRPSRQPMPARTPEQVSSPIANGAPPARLICLDSTVLESTESHILPLLGDAETTIGRAEHCTLRLRPRQVSRVHARIFAGERGWAVEDLDSTNGVFINGRRLTAAWLQDGDEIGCGPVSFRYSLDPTGRPAASDSLSGRTALDWRRHVPSSRSRPGLLVVEPVGDHRRAVIVAGLRTGYNLLIAPREGLGKVLDGFDPDLIVVDLSQIRLSDQSAMLGIVAERARDIPILPILAPECDAAAFRRRVQALRLSLVEPFCRVVEADALAEALTAVPETARPLRPADLGEGMRRHDFLLHFQPKIDIASGEVVGAEALMRWRHPERGMIPPDRFISLAERSGEITALTFLVLEQVVDVLRALERQRPDLSVSVNISARSLAEDGFADRFVASLTEAGIAPERIVLEITETVAMSAPDLVRRVLDGLRRRGFGLSLDDFGTGYSSLEELHRMPFTELKIDKQFVFGLLNDRNAHAITRSTLRLGRELGLKTVAEGVETPAVLDQLRVLGCDIAQGYLISRPLPAADFLSWLARPAA